VAYLLGALAPDRVTRMAALSVGWSPGDLPTPSFEQARQYWYQWFMATERGAAVVRDDGVAFARYQWQTWSPPSFYDDEVFAATAASFANPDWPAVTLQLVPRPMGAGRARSRLRRDRGEEAGGAHDLGADARDPRRRRSLFVGGHVGAPRRVLLGAVPARRHRRRRPLPDSENIPTTFADDLAALAAHGYGPDALDELARIGFGPGMVTVEISEDAISAPAAR